MLETELAASEEPRLRRPDGGPLVTGLVVAYLLALFLVPDRYSFPPASGVAFRPYQGVLVVLAAVLWSRFANGARLRVGRPATTLLLLPLVAALSFIANAEALDQHFFGASVRSFGEMAILALTGIVIAAIGVTPQRRRLIVGTILFALSMSALTGVWEATTHRRSFQGLDKVVPLLGVETFSPLDHGDAGADADRHPTENLGFMTRGGHIRVVGPAKHAIELSALMAIGLPLALAFGIASRRRARRLLLFGVGALLLIVLLLTSSRTGTVGVLVAFAVALALNRRDRRVVAAMVGAAVVLAASALLFVPDRVGGMIDDFAGSSTGGSNEARLTDYHELDRMIGSAPWLGRGIGTWARYQDRTGQPLLLDNAYLLMADEAGIVGLVVFVGILVGGITGALAWASRAGPERHLAVAIACGMTAFAVMAALFDAVYFSQVASLFMIFIGVVAGARRSAEAVAR